MARGATSLPATVGGSVQVGRVVKKPTTPHGHTTHNTRVDPTAITTSIVGGIWRFIHMKWKRSKKTTA